tara:strand:- start:88230 stop:89366 length:1137 start_codon:yes stop_codon:yes gene_type:complete
MSNIEHSGYLDWIGGIKSRIHTAKQRVVLSVNAELLGIYWFIGEALANKKSDWGDKVIDNLARELKVEFPNEKGFSRRNLMYMQQWFNYHSANNQFVQQAVAQFGPNAEKQLVQQLVAQLPSNYKDPLHSSLFGLLFSIPWGHHTLILSKAKTPQETYFYIIETIRNNWSRSVLQHQIQDNLFAAQGSKVNNFDLTLPHPQKDLAKETLKSEYNLDFLGLKTDIQEKELEEALTNHIRKFLMALGKGFAYVGNQHNIQVAGDDFFLDMLFFNINLNCYVVVELKVGDFKPEFIGKLNFYINAVNQIVKVPEQNETIGILLCKTPNTEVIKLSLKGVDTPMHAADYKLTKELKKGLPTKKELEQSLHANMNLNKKANDL